MLESGLKQISLMWEYSALTCTSQMIATDLTARRQTLLTTSLTVLWMAPLFHCDPGNDFICVTRDSVTQFRLHGRKHLYVTCPLSENAVAFSI